jgi:DNA invertase Pin-like site-specific DNA recombinase
VRQDFREKASGARPDRRELLKLLKDLTPGDVMAVTRIDRSTSDLFAIVKQTWTRAGNSARWRSHGRHATNTGRLKIAVLGGRRLHRCRGATWRRPCSP